MTPEELRDYHRGRLRDEAMSARRLAAFYGSEARFAGSTTLSLAAMTALDRAERLEQELEEMW